MPTFAQSILVPLALVVFAVVMMLALILVRMLRRRRPKRRTVESPNSHYSSQLTRDTMARHRWHDMALDRLHEINREEVVRLLAKVEATSAQALSAKERAFLDYMAELGGRPAPSTKRPRHPLEPQLGTG